MKQTTPKKKKIKWELRSSPRSLKVLLAVMLALVLVASLAMWQIHLAIRAYTEELRQEVSDLEYANGQLQEKVDNPDSAQNIAQVAEEELGMVDPDTVIVGP